MRSFTILAAVSLASAISSPQAAASTSAIVTVTKTHTVCPLTTRLTCAASPIGGIDGGIGKGPDYAGQDPNDAEDAWASLWDKAKTEFDGRWNDWNNQAPTSSASSTTSSSSSDITKVTTSTSGSNNGSQPTTSSSYGNGTSTSSATTSATSSATCVPTPLNATYDVCNDACDRSKWCNDRTVDTDTLKDNYFTGKLRKYTLEITNTTLVYDGTGPKLALAINGQVPGPVIEADWGDVVEITVINKLQDNSTSIHWHGIRQVGTNDQDGVPGVSECPIPGNGGQRTYTWHASSYGTAWYHSHVFAQYGDGIRGPIVIHGPATANYDYDMGTVMIDDTFTVTAAATASRMAHIGPGGSFNTLFNGKGLNPDGKSGTAFQWGIKPGKKHLFRFINSASQQSWVLEFDAHVMTVIAADLVPIVPYKTTTLKIANGQRYDVILEGDQPVGRYFLRAVIQTQCPSGGANSGLGVANAIINYEGAEANATLVSRTVQTNLTANICEDEPLESLVPRVPRAAGSLTKFQAASGTIPAGSITSVVSSESGKTFQWFINNAQASVDFTQPSLQTINSNGNSSLISNAVYLNTVNDWVYFIIQNQFFASHPMHVHGHDVSILGQGNGPFANAGVGSLKFDNPMYRDTVMLRGAQAAGQPAGYTVIGFETDNPGAWLMHCHITWHVDGGLALQFIERENEIPNYSGKQVFKDQCSALKTYQDANPQSAKELGQSGLKKRGEELDVRNYHPGAKMHVDKYRKRYGHAM